MSSLVKEGSRSGTRLILGGGGNASQSLPLDRQLAEWMPPASTLLYWPFGLPNSHPLVKTCESWIVSVFHPLGVAQIETWHASELAAKAEQSSLDSFGAIYIGGGNTFRLLERIRSTGLDRKLTDFVGAGGPISGGSAGAIIFGKDIGFAAHFGDRNESNLADTAGLDLFRDERGRSCLVLPHFVAQWRASAQRLAAGSGATVLCIEEDAGVIIDGPQWRAVGSGGVTLVHPE